MMTQEDKELLFKDLCARLPYDTIVHISNPAYSASSDEKLTIWTIDNISFSGSVKPYLRPLSSMTEEEENEYRAINCYEGLFPRNEEALDYVLANHFDFRGLIPMGLALEAPEEMYKNE